MPNGLELVRRGVISSPFRPLNRFCGHRSEEVHHVAIGIIEQHGPVAPGHQGRLLDEFADVLAEAQEFLVNIIHAEFDNHGAVLCGGTGMA